MLLRGAGVTLIRIHLSILSSTPPELFLQYGLPALRLGIENHVGVTIDNCDICAWTDLLLLLQGKTEAKVNYASKVWGGTAAKGRA